MVHGAVHRGFREHPCRFLEGCGCEEALGIQRCTSHTQQYRACRCGIAGIRDHLVVDLFVNEPIHELTRQQVGASGRVNAYLAHHLANDHLDVLLVDRHTL